MSTPYAQLNNIISSPIMEEKGGLTDQKSNDFGKNSENNYE